jgi:hypothetical protein
MPGIEDVLERLVTDPAFRALLRTDPGSALTGYTLTAEDLSLLARQVGTADGATNPVEQRTARAGFFGLYAQVDNGSGVVIRGPNSPPQEPTQD